MKKRVLQIILSILCLSSQAQKVSNIRAEQHGQDIIVFYSLETTLPCEVNLLLSQDNGLTWSLPLINISGDNGRILTGGEKKIIWSVLDEYEQLVGEKLKFKVIANGRNPYTPEMVFALGGTFKMGSNLGKYQGPVHGVLLSSFFIGKYEVTQFEWKEIMGSNPSYFKDCDLCPVEQVSWQDVQLFIRRLNEKTGLSYRLPTEAEWEYAARGGKTGQDFRFAGSDKVQEVGWYSLNSEKRTRPVGSLKSNELGLHDLSGNVDEWCYDYFEDYTLDFKVNPNGPTKGQMRVIRGGGWDDSFEVRLHTTVRGYFYPFEKSNDIGFRLVLPVDKLPK
jgi:formylglycine-generating enzyme required for sulfatase activity